MSNRPMEEELRKLHAECEKMVLDLEQLAAIVDPPLDDDDDDDDDAYDAEHGTAETADDAFDMLDDLEKSLPGSDDKPTPSGRGGGGGLLRHASEAGGGGGGGGGGGDKASNKSLGRLKGASGLQSSNTQPITGTGISGRRETVRGGKVRRIDTGLAAGQRRRKNEMFDVFVTLPDDTQVCRQFSAQSSVKDIKKSMMQYFEEQQPNADPSAFVLRVFGYEHYVTNEALVLQRVPLVQVCTKSFVSIRFELVPISSCNPSAAPDLKKSIGNELAVNAAIAATLGDAIGSWLSWDIDSLDSFRRALARNRLELRDQLRNMGPWDKYPQHVRNEPLPITIPATFSVTANLPADGQSVVKSKLAVSTEASAEELIKKVFAKYQRQVPKKAEGRKAEDFLLKTTGFASFLHGPTRLIEYDFIRTSLVKKTEIELTLVMLELAQPDDTEPVVDCLLAQDDPAAPVIEKQSVWEINRPFRVKIVGAEKVPAKREEDQGAIEYSYFVLVEVYHSMEAIAKPEFTKVAELDAVAGTLRFNQWVCFNDNKYSDIAKGMKLCMTLYRRLKTAVTGGWITDTNAEADFAIGWANCQLVDHTDTLMTGLRTFKLWPTARANPIGTCVENLAGKDVPVLTIEFDSFQCPAYLPPDPPFNMDEYSQPEQRPPQVIVSQLEATITKDPMAMLSQQEKQMVYKYRYWLKENRHALPKFLFAVNWANREEVLEAHRMLRVWKRPTALESLELLDARYADPEVRSFAVECLEEGADSEYTDFLLQLTQVLKYEAHHNSALAQFLLKKALSEKATVGHNFFWHLKSEMHLPEIAERYGLLLEAYVRGCGPTGRDMHVSQNQVITKMVAVANKIKPIDVSQRLTYMRDELKSLKLPSQYNLPLDPKMSVNGLRIEKCKYMDSKKLPLWLVFTNAEPNAKTITVIFKSGDDLRQDGLTLQMLKIMDKLWKREGMDLLMQIYGCVSTGDEEGMIQVVLSSATTANINYEAGGATKVLSKDTLTNWIRKNNPTPDAFAKAQENFHLSCAAYCVATYVLGIGDRHNDNIMMTQMGHLFHIDFGHFLGNYKKKFGLKRERSPFIFTKQYSNVLGGRKAELFHKFISTCQRAYNILRKHSSLFINLFLMMLSTGIPELQTIEDISYLKNALMIGATDEQAAAKFEELIYEAKKTKTTLANDFVHIVVHN